MDISNKATVYCTNGECGQISKLIIDPNTNELTHIVVEENRIPKNERIVPISYIDSTDENSVHLSCPKQMFFEMENFISHVFYPAEKAYGIFPLRPKVYIPYHSSNKKYADVPKKMIPAGEISFDIGASVFATDGYVGSVDEFLIDPKSEHITHLVMVEGPFWNKRQVAIPVSNMEQIEENAVHLNINKSQIEDLPSPLNIVDKEPESSGY